MQGAFPPFFNKSIYRAREIYTVLCLLIGLCDRIDAAQRIRACLFGFNEVRAQIIILSYHKAVQQRISYSLNICFFI